MRTLVLYFSKTGNTKKYAEEIAMATHADLLPAPKFKPKMIKDYDTIVFGPIRSKGSMNSSVITRI